MTDSGGSAPANVARIGVPAASALSAAAGDLPPPAALAPFGYADLGEAFIRYAVTPERVQAAVSDIAGETVEIEVKGVGPGRLASARAKGTIRGVDVSSTTVTPLVGYLATIDVALRVTVVVARTLHVFNGDVSIRLDLTVRAAPPLEIVIDVATPRPSAVRVALVPEGGPSKAVARLGGLDGEIRTRLVDYVVERLDDPSVHRLRHIDLRPLIDDGWEGLR